MARIMRTKSDVKSKRAFTLGNKQSGGKERSGVVVTYKDDTKQTFLTPAGKSRKFVEELKSGEKLTNDMQVKTDKKGKPRRLRDTERAYRSGYLAARKDAAKAYKAKNGDK